MIIVKSFVHDVAKIDARGKYHGELFEYCEPFLENTHIHS